MEEDVTQSILARGMELSTRNWNLMEAYGVVTVAICAGFRPKELRMLSISNVSIKDNGVEIFAEHVKGENSYGVARWAPLHPDGILVFMKYLEARKVRLKEANKIEDALFQPLKHNGGYLSYNRIRKLKSMVEEDLGIKFDLGSAGARSVREPSTRGRRSMTCLWSWVMLPSPLRRGSMQTRTYMSHPGI